MPQPIQVGGAGVDLSPRYYFSKTVANSPATSTEVIVATLTVSEDIAVKEAVRLSGYAAFTAGTDATSAVLKIRRTDITGTIIVTSGLIPVTAAVLYDRAIIGIDVPTAVLSQIYVLTLLMTAASAASTVSAVAFDALVI